jgi:hypothetical protein
MSSTIKLGLYLFAMTLTVPALVWLQSTSWRLAWHAWKQYAAWMGALYLLGLVVWFFMWVVSPPMP